MEKEMAIHSSTIAWKIPWTQEPSRLQSMGSQRVGHDWVKAIMSVCLSVSFHHQSRDHIVSLLFIQSRIKVTVNICWVSVKEGMATHSSFLAWRIPWTVASHRLKSMWLQGVEHDWAGGSVCGWWESTELSMLPHCTLLTCVKTLCTLFSDTNFQLKEIPKLCDRA